MKVRPIPEVLEFFHAFLGFCVDPGSLLSPMSKFCSDFLLFSYCSLYQQFPQCIYNYQSISIYLSTTGEAIVQWSSVPSCEPRVPGLIPQYPLTTFHFLALPLSGQRLPKLLPYCSQTGLTMLYASEALAVMSLTSSQHIHRENVNIRGVTIINLKPTPNNRQEASPSVTDL